MGAAGVTVGGIVALLKAERMEVARQTVHEWLKADAAKGLVESRGGKWFWIGG
jgi:hypothetical protein